MSPDEYKKRESSNSLRLLKTFKKHKSKRFKKKWKRKLISQLRKDVHEMLRKDPVRFIDDYWSSSDEYE